MVHIMFSAYSVTSIFEQHEFRTEKVKSCAYDYSEKKIILLTKSNMKGDNQRYVKVLDA
jgi:hypothetical protein